MQVKTINPIIIKGQVFNNTQGMYSNLDGSSSGASVKAFQTWYNSNKGGSLKVDGKWGPKTASAWSSAGTDYEASWKAAIQGIQGFRGANGSVPSPSGGGATPSEAAPAKASKKTKSGKTFGEKVKGLFDKAKSSGKLDEAKQLASDKLGLGNGPASAGGDKPEVIDLGKPEEKGMSKNLKAGLIVSLLLIGGFVVYKVSKSNGKGK